VAVEVNAGEKPVTVTTDGDADASATVPANAQLPVDAAVFAHVEVVPHSNWRKPDTVKSAAGIVTVRVPRAPVVGVTVIEPEVPFINARVPTTEPAVPNEPVPFETKFPLEAVIANLSVLTATFPVTSSVPATSVFPDDAVTVNLFVLMARFPTADNVVPAEMAPAMVRESVVEL